MTDEELIKALSHLKVETRSPACLGCGYEHNCGIHGCAIIREAAERLDAAKQDIQLAAEGVICDICTHSGEDAGDKKTACWDCTRGNPKFEWRGPQCSAFRPIID